MTFESVYEILNKPTEIRKQRFWDWFDGDALRSWWTKNDLVGNGTFAMVDTVDEGFGVTTGAINNNSSSINFGDIRPFNETACVCIGIVKRVSDLSNLKSGLANITLNDSIESAFYRDDTVRTFKELRTGDNIGNTVLATDIVIDTNFTKYKIECGSANIKLSLDGILKITKTTDRPTVRLQPDPLNMSTRTSAAREGRSRYCEVYNT